MMSITPENSPSSQASSRSKRRGGNQRGAVWKNFVEKEDANGDIVVSCRECMKVFKHPSTSTIMSYHWRTQHPDKEKPAKKIGSSREHGQPKTKHARIEDALSDALAIPGVSVNMFLNPLMRKFHTAMNSNIEMPKSFATLKSMLLSKSANVQKTIKETVMKLKVRPSMTCDIWTDKGMKHSYLGMTLHCLDSSFSLQRVFLGLKELHGPHTGFFLRSKAEELLRNYGFTLDNLYKTVTDSGSNMVSAFKDLLKIDISMASLDEDCEDMMEYGQAGFCLETENLDDEIIDENGEETMELLIQTAFPIRIRCFAHCLQLVIMKFFESSVNCHEGFKNLKAVIGKFHHSFSATNELETATGQSLKSPCTTRWASYILVIGSFLEVHETVTEIAKNKRWNTPNASQIEFLKSVHKLSKILVDVLVRIQGEKFVTISRCHGYVKAIKRSLEKAKLSPDTEEMATNMELLLDKRFSWMMDAYDTDFDSVYVMAAALDPNTVHLLNKENFDLAVKAILPFIAFETPEQLQVDRPSTEETELDIYLNEIAEEELRKRQQSAGIRSSAKSWVGDILNRGIAARSSSPFPIDPLKYWSNLIETEYKVIAILALKVLSVPATSAPIERIFSLAGLATRNQRNRTNVDLLNSQLIVYCNMFGEKI